VYAATDDWDVSYELIKARKSSSLLPRSIVVDRLRPVGLGLVRRHRRAANNASETTDDNVIANTTASTARALVTRFVVLRAQNGLFRPIIGLLERSLLSDCVKMCKKPNEV